MLEARRALRRCSPQKEGQHESAKPSVGPALAKCVRLLALLIFVIAGVLTSAAQQIT
jgi:hypothetical protein